MFSLDSNFNIDILLMGYFRGSQQDLFNAMGSMYAAVLFIGVQNATSVQPVVAIERTVFYRERAAGMYSALPYAFGQVKLKTRHLVTFLFLVFCFRDSVL